MVNNIQKDKNKRILFLKNELKRLQYKYIINNLTLSKDIRFNYVLKLNKLPKNTCKIQIRNRCIFSGRARSVYRFCRMSRIYLKNLSSRGMLNGIVKSTW